MTLASAAQLPSCPAHLSESQIAQYHEDGYLAFADVLTFEEVDGARIAVSELITRGTREAGAQTWRDGKFFVQLEPGQTVDPNVPAEENELKVRKIMGFQNDHPHLTFLCTKHPRIQNIVSAILGPDSILFQDMALIKPPFIGTEKPWHQDDAYFSYEPLGAIMGVWIALDDAAVANGCMHTIPGGHLLGPKKHHHTFDCEIEDGRLDTARAVPVEIPAGGAMFFHGLLPHQTPPNTSPDRRRALQFHYRGANTRKLERADYDAVFVEADGTPASCAAAPKK